MPRALGDSRITHPGERSAKVPKITIGTGAPASTNRQPIGSFYVDKTAKIAYQLTGYTAGLAVWRQSSLTFSTALEAIDLTNATTALTPSSMVALSNFTAITHEQSPVMQSNATTGAAPSGATGAVNLMQLNHGLFSETMEQFILGAGQTIIAPRMAAAGLLVSLDLTDNEGAEYNWGARANARHVYTAGTDACYCEWRFTLADVSGCDPVGIGFRKVEANNAALASYTDFAFIGVSEADTTAVITLKTRLNSAGDTNTNTTDAWTDGQTHTLRVDVSAAGAVTYLIDGVAPTVTAAFSFDATDTIMPFFRGLHGTTTPGAWHWVSNEAGPA